MSTVQTTGVHTERRSAFGPQLLAKVMHRSFGDRASIRVVDSHGNPHLIGNDANPPFEITLKDNKVAWEMLADPTLAFGEAYMNNRVVVSKGGLYEFLDHVVGAMSGRESTGPLWRERLRKHTRWLGKLNTLVRSKTNIKYHYDDKAEIWDLFLDAYRQYTCGYFPTAEETIDEAQIAKMDHIAKKLILKPGMKVLDIGSGWGGLAVHLAKNYGVEVDGITLSKDQLEFAEEYTKQNGVSDKVHYRIQDYRNLDQTYDRIVAVGMMEHVGVEYYQKYFETIRRSLKPDGIALVHVIGRPTPPGANEPFINKYIFPGSHAPALSEIVKPVELSKLFLTDLEIWRQHYAKTLRAWREKFYENWDRAQELYGDTFCRMWEYYLASCEAAFNRGLLQIFQIQLAKRFNTVPVTRDYIY